MGSYQDLRRRRFRRGGGAGAVFIERRPPPARRAKHGNLFGQDSYGVVTRRGTALPPAARELICLVDPEYPVLERGGKKA